MNGDRRGLGWAIVIGAGSACLLQGSTQGAATSPALGAGSQETTAAAARLFLADLDGDGRLDKLRVAGDGSLSVALNRGGGAFEPVSQTIPGAAPHAVLADDLDGDGLVDLHLLTAQGVRAFRGDGTGLLREATAELGLENGGLAVRAERVDLDGVPPLELVLHELDGDVVFWPEGSAFRRDPDSPPRVGAAPSPAHVVRVEGQAPSGAGTASEPGTPGVAIGSRGPTAGAASSSSLPRPSTGPTFALEPGDEGTGCSDSITDQARPTVCLKASTVPALGQLYPLGPRFFVSTSGRVGIGTTNPAYDLDVVSTFHCGTVTADTTIKTGGTTLSSNAQIDCRDPVSNVLGATLRGSTGFHDLRLMDGAGGTTITLDGLTGRTKTKVLEITGGADLVEGFETDVPRVEPGTVMCIDPAGPSSTGELVPCAAPYDRRVAGVVSGAGGVSPGIRMGQAGVLEGEVPVAMAGRVWVRSTAEGGPIEPGDLLTTSASVGCAMKAADATRSPGAVLGKALTGLSEGTGLVLVLVDLQ